MKIQSTLLLLLATLAPTWAEDKSEEFEACDAATTCEDCLGLGFCDWYGGGLCSHNQAQVMDVAMFSLDESSTIADVCAEAAIAEADSNLCSSQKDCASCTSSVLTDGVSTCQWFKEYGFCGSECNMVGCGDTTCAPIGLPDPGTPMLPVVDENPISGATGPTGNGSPLSGFDSDEIMCRSQVDSTACATVVLSDAESSCVWSDESMSCVVVSTTEETQANGVSAAAVTGKSILLILGILSVILQ